MAWTIVSALVVESVVFALAALPGAWLWVSLARLLVAPEPLRIFVLAMAAVPAYVLFALCLVVLSPLVMRLLRWRTPPDATLAVADLEWPLLTWGRYLVSAHVVRLFAGPVFRATPVWTFYHRLNGARLGRRVYINSLAVMDDNLLECGAGVVIGAGVHLSGHTVEGGMVKTGAVRLGRDVTIGVGSVIGIGVTVGAGTQVGALSVVPKHQVLDPDALYGGAPARRLTPGPRPGVLPGRRVAV